MKKSTSALLASLVCAAVGVGAWMGRAVADASNSPVVWPAADIQWADSAAMKGAKIATLWGDPKTGAYGALKSIPAGGALALHTHTQNQRVIVLAGVIALAIEGRPAKDMGPGSYAFIPGGMKHTANCKAGAECRYFEEQPGASDIVFAEDAAPAK